MNWTAILWLVLLVLFVVAEASTVTLVSVWFAAGALVSLIASLLKAELWLQAVLFFAVSGLMLLLMRPWLRTYVRPKIVKTNVDAVIGTNGIVTEEIDNMLSCGQVKIGAMTWTARSTSGAVIGVGTQVKADRIEGVKVFVSPIKVTEKV